jgi:predicted nucleic acid-binding protein
MGTLSLPTGGRVCIDTPVLVYTAASHPTYLPLLVPLWEAGERQRIDIVACTLIEMEATIGPRLWRDRDVERAEAELSRIKTLLKRNVRLLPVTRDVVSRATDLRVEVPSLKVADAIHLAACDWSKCEMFLTNDRRLKVAEKLGIPVVVLQELLDT